MKLPENIKLRPILYAAAAFVLLPLVGIVAGAGLGYAAAAYAGLAWYGLAGLALAGGVAGFFPGQFVGVNIARFQIQKVVVELASFAGETALTRFAKFLAEKTGISEETLKSPLAKDTVRAVTESLAETKPKSLKGIGAFFKKAVMKVAVKQSRKPPENPKPG